MPDLLPFADTFLRLFQEHQFSRSDDEPITSLTIQDAYHVQQMVIDARIKPHHAAPLIEDPQVSKRVDQLAAPGGPLHGII